MSDLFARERLQPSLLDRLTDDAPDRRKETFDQQTLSMPQLRAAVLRDLAWLLNTTNLATAAPDAFAGAPLAATSTVNYGIPGFAGTIEGSARLLTLEDAIADAIRAFEPRIRPDSVRVTAITADQEALPSLVFQLSAELWGQPAPQQLFLETKFELETRRVAIADIRPRG